MLSIIVFNFLGFANLLYSILCAFLIINEHQPSHDDDYFNAGIIIWAGLINIFVAYFRLGDGLDPCEMPLIVALVLAGCINLATSYLIMKTHRSRTPAQHITADHASTEQKLQEDAEKA
ncbi:hypothetical protein BDZ94DRAFT_1246314 [Collybia nuda]|uniref:Uncharacterized protein n=1 Tax=Collybia nuda TaxID=64659 RepID=A0A9P5YE05_9AGAR|nr:hypothetical protein BDZ94DRAFT_1246314 [Collybia nuda]